MKKETVFNWDTESLTILSKEKQQAIERYLSLVLLISGVETLCYDNENHVIETDYHGVISIPRKLRI